MVTEHIAHKRFDKWTQAYQAKMHIRTTTKPIPCDRFLINNIHTPLQMLIVLCHHHYVIIELHTRHPHIPHDLYLTNFRAPFV